MNKKGALELSVNAIVILIIALTVLGLVLGFAVSKFRGLSEQLVITEETPTATPQIPIQFPGGDNELTLTKGQTTQLTLSIYNPSVADIEFRGATGNQASYIDGSCAGPDTINIKNSHDKVLAAMLEDDTDDEELVFDTVGNIGKGKTGDAIAVVTAEGGLSTGTYSCLIEIYAYDSTAYTKAISRSIFLNII